MSLFCNDIDKTIGLFSGKGIPNDLLCWLTNVSIYYDNTFSLFIR